MKKLTTVMGMSLLEIVYALFLITLGSVIYAGSVTSFIVPNDFSSGGVTGVSILLYYAFKVPIGTMNFIINSLLLILGWSLLEKRTLVFTIYALCILSLAMNYIDWPAFQSDNILVTAIGGGVLGGLGLGLIIRGNGTSAGTDIVAMLLKKYFGISFSAGIMLCDFAILAASTYMIGVENLVVTLILAFILSRTLEYFTEGLNPRKSVMIISNQQEIIAKEIALTIDRGITVFHAHGHYSKQEKQVLYVVVNSNQIIHMQRLINQIDPEAFVTVSDVRQVLGQGFSFYSIPDRKRKFYQK